MTGWFTEQNKKKQKKSCSYCNLDKWKLDNPPEHVAAAKASREAVAEYMKANYFGGDNWIKLNEEAYRAVGREAYWKAYFEARACLSVGSSDLKDQST